MQMEVKEVAEFPHYCLSSPDEVNHFIKNELQEISHLLQESFWLITLNAKNRVIRKEMLFLGTIDSCNCDMKIIFRRIFLAGASAFISVHNHPSGDPAPSRDDIHFFKALKSAADLLMVKYLDNIIVGENRFYSFVESHIE